MMDDYEECAYCGTTDAKELSNGGMSPKNSKHPLWLCGVCYNDDDINVKYECVGCKAWIYESYDNSYRCSDCDDPLCAECIESIKNESGGMYNDICKNCWDDYEETWECNFGCGTMLKGGDNCPCVEKMTAEEFHQKLEVMEEEKLEEK